MNRDEVISKLRAHEAELKAAGIVRLAVFGSVARGDNSPESDVDLLADFDKTKRYTLLTMGGSRIVLLICLERDLTHEVVKAMADRKPERVVCLDESFAGNDQLKANAVQTMKAKGVTSFKTV